MCVKRERDVSPPHSTDDLCTSALLKCGVRVCVYAKRERDVLCVEEDFPYMGKAPCISSVGGTSWTKDRGSKGMMEA